MADRPEGPSDTSGARRTTWRQRALYLWAAGAVAVTVKTIVSPELHTVFPKFAAGAVHWWDQLPLYAHYEGLGSFRYSPTFAVVMTPFAVLAPMITWGLLDAVARRKGRVLISVAFVMTMVLGWGAVQRLLTPHVAVAVATLPVGTLLFAIWLVCCAPAAGSARATPYNGTHRARRPSRAVDL